jgi:hypothetical protein
LTELGDSTREEGKQDQQQERLQGSGHKRWIPVSSSLLF